MKPNMLSKNRQKKSHKCDFIYVKCMQEANSQSNIDQWLPKAGKKSVGFLFEVMKMFYNWISGVSWATQGNTKITEL